MRIKHHESDPYSGRAIFAQDDAPEDDTHKDPPPPPPDPPEGPGGNGG